MGSDWTYDVESVIRIAPDQGAEVEIFVTDVEDEAEIVRLAMHHLQDGFTAWARVTAGRQIANDDEPP